MSSGLITWTDVADPDPPDPSNP
uniref:Uncharacterized protein n=1 Tax=Moniliophthora roreri TaxID=221103 RepID=A0A0W0F7Q2_MONRR